MRVAIGVSVLGLCLLGPASAQEKADPREKLDTAIAEAIRLLEAKDYETLLKNFVPPDELKRITERKSFDEFVKEFSKGKAATLLEVLKWAKDKKPTLDKDGRRADFGPYKEGSKSFKMYKIGDYWYIGN